MGRQKIEKHACVYVADTECTTTVDYENDGHVYAYIMDMIAIDHADMTAGNATALPKEIVYSGPDTMKQWVAEFLEKIPDNAQIWFYNSRYDATFILDWLMNHEGYLSDDWDTKEAKRIAKKKAKIKFKNTHPEYREQVRFVDGKLVKSKKGTEPPRAVTNEWASRRLIHPIRSGSRLIECEIYNSKGNKLVILDVGNKWTGLPDWDEKNNVPLTGVQAMAVMFGMTKTPLDVLKARGDGYVPTEEEITRCKVDTEIIKVGMEAMFELGLTECTLAADAWKIYTYIKDIGIKGDDKEGKKTAKLEKLGIHVEPLSLPDDGILDKLPEISEPFTDRTTVDVRGAYKGGVTIVNKKYKGKLINTKKRNIGHDDCNSMHPTSMKCPMPYGAYWRSYEPEGEFYIMQCQCKFKLKHGKLPVISNPSGLDCAEWLEEGEKLLTLTSYDWKWVYKNYDVEVIGRRHYLNWHTRVNEANCIYVDHFMGEKEKWGAEKKRLKDIGDMAGMYRASAMRHINKILMNALYGKFGQDPEKPWEWCKVVDGSVSYGKSNVRAGEFDDPFVHKYLPMACAITGCSRDRLWDHIERIGYENFLYSDTDSAFFFTDATNDEELYAELRAKGIDVDPYRLGAWDVEDGIEGDDGKIVLAKFIRPKVYGFVKKSGRVTIKTAGLPIEARKKMTSLDEMYIGAVFKGAKKVPKNVPGGQILVANDFTLKEH